jgi:hypothetical protein
VTSVTLYGRVDSQSTAVFVPLVLGTDVSGARVLVPDTDPKNVLASTVVPPADPNAPFGTFEIPFSPGFDIPPGGKVAFGFVVPLTSESGVDATLFGTDTLRNFTTSTNPPWWTGFYISTFSNQWGLAIGNHYLVVNGVR